MLEKYTEAALLDGSSLSVIESWIWDYWIESTKSAKMGFHLGVLTTVSGDFPESRYVVLRDVSKEERTLRCHTDYRSSKVREIRFAPAVSFLFYSADLKIQVRAKGLAQVHYNNEVSRLAWEQSGLSSRRCYLSRNAPGTELSEPGAGLPEHLLGRVPTEEESIPGYENFAAIVCTVSHISWLYLAATGHRSASFVYEGSEVKSAWINP